tara:strand:+ start:324 stop:863 length:540 start_codon:yes stop_codon:yes gene_type:complete
MVLLPISRDISAIAGLDKPNFLRIFSNYNKGDTYDKSRIMVGKGISIRGGTMVSIGPVNDIGAQQKYPENVDLIQRPAEYRANSSIMKDIIQANVEGYHNNQLGLIPQTTGGKLPKRKAVSRKSKSSSMPSPDTIYNDYMSLKTAAKKKKFVESLGKIYRKNPEGNAYIMDGFNKIKGI